MDELPRVLVVGPSRSGKDTACAYLASVTRLRFAGSTSRYLAPHVAARLGVTEAQAWRTRHGGRNLWSRVGNELRRGDPGLLVREALRHAELVAGVRAAGELAACRAERLVDLVVWVANRRAGRDSTLRFAERDCDVTVANHGTLAEFHANLLRLARSEGLPMRPRGG